MSLSGVLGRQTGTIAVGFGGQPRRTVELTWSQQYYLAEQNHAAATGRSLAIQRLFPIRPGLLAGDVAAALTDLLQRFEALRSHFHGSVPPRQVVAGSGVLAVSTWEATDSTAADLGATLLAELAAAPFDPSHELPVRAAIISERSEPRYLALAFSHVAVDGYALVAVGQRLVATCAHLDPVDRPPSTGQGGGHQPHEQVEFERSPAGQRSAGRALRYAEQVLRTMPAGAAEGPTGRYEFLSYRSAALDRAVGAVCGRTAASPSAVLLAAAVSVMADEAGTDSAYLALLAANRTRPGSATAVVPMSLPVPCLVDVRHPDFDSLVTAAAGTSLGALRYGHFPPAGLAEVKHRVEAERGVRLDITPTLNYRPRASKLPVRPVTAAELSAAASDRSLSWVDSSLCWDSTHYLTADVSAAGIELMLQVDTGRRGRAEAERWLRTLEETVTGAALSRVP